MSNHFTGLSLGAPLGDQRHDLCGLHAFQSPANPNADAPHPDAIYRLNIDKGRRLPDGHRIQLCS